MVIAPFAVTVPGLSLSVFRSEARSGNALPSRRLHLDTVTHWVIEL